MKLKAFPLRETMEAVKGSYTPEEI